MSGFPINDPGAPQVDVLLVHSSKQTDLWRWRTRIDGKDVEITLGIGELRTLANRALRNKSKTAYQGGLTARVMTSRQKGKKLL